VQNVTKEVGCSAKRVCLVSRLRAAVIVKANAVFLASKVYEEICR